MLKRHLDALRPLSKGALESLEAWYEVELTYTSNALEGNTLTRQETALVLGQGITLRGKPLKDHLEAIDHQDAWRLVRELAQCGAPIVDALETRHVSGDTAPWQAFMTARLIKSLERYLEILEKEQGPAGAEA